MAGNFLQRSRHGTTYFFRRRVPDDLQPILLRRQLYKSLCTCCRQTAIIRARVLAVRTDHYFQQVRMGRSKDEGLRIDWALSYDMGELGMLRVETSPHDTDEDKAKAISAFQEVAQSAIKARRGDQAQPRLGVEGRGGKTFQDAVEEYLAGAEIKPRTITAYRRALEDQATPFFGADAFLTSINQTRFSEYVAHLRSNKGWSDSTVAGYVIPVTAMFKWHGSRMEGVPAITTAKLLPKRTTPEDEERDAFTLEQLAEVARNAVRYLDNEPEKYWATVATAFTGCRIEEISQVNLATDFRYDDAHDIYYLDLNESPDADGVVRKSLKRLSSWRVLPIHSALRRAGFVDFLQLQVKAGRTRPFEGLWDGWLDRRTGSIKWSHYISKWGGRELEKLNKQGRIDRAGFELAYFHSMRHTFANILTKNLVPEEQRAALQGQQYGNVNASRYSKLRGDVLALSKIVEANLEELASAVFRN